MNNFQSSRRFQMRKFSEAMLLQSLLVKSGSVLLKSVFWEQWKTTRFYNYEHEIMKHFQMFLCGLDSSQVKRCMLHKYKSFLARRVAERQIRALGNWEILQKAQNRYKQNLVPSLISRKKTLPLVVKNYAKADTKVFSSCPSLFDFLTLFYQFCPRL